MNPDLSVIKKHSSSNKAPESTKNQNHINSKEVATTDPTTNYNYNKSNSFVPGVGGSNILPLNYIRSGNMNNINNINTKQSYNKSNNSNVKYYDKGGISVISSNEEVHNPFINNQNVTHMTKFYELNADQIRERMFNVMNEITKIVDANDPEIMKQVEALNTKYGGLIEFENENDNEEGFDDDAQVNILNFQDQGGDNAYNYNDLRDQELDINKVIYNNQQNQYNYNDGDHVDNDDADNHDNHEYEDNVEIGNDDDIYDEYQMNDNIQENNDYDPELLLNNVEINNEY